MSRRNSIMSAPEQTSAHDSREAAVVDVGSNSVRLVVYRLDGRAMTPVLNEKVMAGLGRDLSNTGLLSRTGQVDALRALRRFALVLDARKPHSVDAVATAAVREARDGGEFVARVKAETGLALRIIDGRQEARLSALGVLAGAPDARGVVGDLGGSSLELVAVAPDGPGDGDTFPLGHLALMGSGPFDYARMVETVDAHLARSPAIKGVGGDFYAVGGAWRAIGRIDVAINRHPLSVLHHHEMSRQDALKIIEFVRKQSKRSLQTLEEAAAKRADSLPYAAVVLERVLLFGGFEKVVLSSFGLREGLLFERLDARARAMHPLWAAADAFTHAAGRPRAFGARLAAWIAPAFAGGGPVFSSARDDVLRGAAARLADVGGGLHPDQRHEIMFELVVRAPLAAITHPERAFLAGAIHHRYSKSPPTAPAFERLLTDDQRRAAAALGAALRLGCDLSARSEAILDRTTLALVDGAVQLAAPGAEDLISDQVLKRLDSLGAALGARVGLAPRIS
ncbi:MAG: Ppx/GppA family phosphatase [Hyphomonadaceae bacterium]|nr:Ppx/GppA family phosphatase [Hyphomonadaceae bacterium]